MMRELRATARTARKQGWDIRQTRNGHYQWFSPEGQLVTTTPGSAAGERSAKNYLAYLKRAGLSTSKGGGR